MEYHESVNIKRTERCLEKIKAYKTGVARAILLFGKPGVGKSSLAEHITGISGLSGASETGTERCQIIDTQINETEHFVVDTPGFEDERGAWATFCEIAQRLDHFRDHAAIVGIFFVTPINTFKRRADSFEERLYTAKLFGTASDRGSRGQYFATWGGSGDYIGSAEQNDWLRDQMWRRFTR
ncbi:hypothetical protein CNMCM6069_001116 [Aspergillus lentulus]|nr:hypothetical protein CNMCM6069_001116 [Aspergillus lentulus]